MTKIPSSNVGMFALAGAVLLVVGAICLFIRPSYGVGYLGLSVIAFVVARRIYKREQRE